MIQQGTSKLPCVDDNAADACARFVHAVVMSVAPSGYSLLTLHQLTAAVFPSLQPSQRWKGQRRKHSHRVVQEVKVRPDAAVWNALIAAAGRAGQLQRAFEALQDMQVQCQLLVAD